MRLFNLIMIIANLIGVVVSAVLLCLSIEGYFVFGRSGHWGLVVLMVGFLLFCELFRWVYMLVYRGKGKGTPPPTLSESGRESPYQQRLREIARNYKKQDNGCE